MGPAMHSEPEHQYQEWLAALAKAMGESGPATQPKSLSRPKTPTQFSEETSFRSSGGRIPTEEPFATAPSQAAEKNPSSFLPPRVWDLCSPYLMIIGSILVVGFLGGVLGLVSILGKAQWLSGPSSSSGFSGPLEAQWQVRRQGLHILPDPHRNSADSDSQSEQPSSETPSPPAP